MILQRVVLMRTTPCKDCTKRSVTCHSTCEEYRNWSEERKKMLDAEYKDRLTHIALNEIKFGKR